MPTLFDEFASGRYTTSAFMRMKLGDGLAARGFAPHVFESREEARKGLKSNN